MIRKFTANNGADQEKGAKRRRLAGQQPSVTAFLRAAGPRAASRKKKQVPLTLATLARRTSQAPSTRPEMEALLQQAGIAWETRCGLLHLRPLLRASIVLGQDPTKRTPLSHQRGGKTFVDVGTTTPPLSILDMNILGGHWKSPRDVAELLLPTHAAPLALDDYLPPVLAEIVCSYLGQRICYEPLPAGTLANAELWQQMGINERALSPRFPLHEHGSWTVVQSQEAHALYTDPVFKEAAAAVWLRRGWNLLCIPDAESLNITDEVDREQAWSLYCRYRHMYWTFIELRLNAGLKTVFEHVAHRLNTFFSLSSQSPPSNKWPFILE